MAGFPSKISVVCGLTCVNRRSFDPDRSPFVALGFDAKAEEKLAIAPL
jgi:hypothetical protein